MNEYTNIVLRRGVAEADNLDMAEVGDRPEVGTVQTLAEGAPPWTTD